jgi:hypothetical protein
VRHDVIEASSQQSDNSKILQPVKLKFEVEIVILYNSATTIHTDDYPVNQLMDKSFYNQIITYLSSLIIKALCLVAVLIINYLLLDNITTQSLVNLVRIADDNDDDEFRIR